MFLKELTLYKGSNKRRKLKFQAELKETKQSKKGLDNLYTIKFETSNPMILDLGKLPSDTLFNIEVGIEE